MEVGEVKFTDVNENDWYYNELEITLLLIKDI